MKYTYTSSKPDKPCVEPDYVREGCLDYGNGFCYYPHPCKWYLHDEAEIRDAIKKAKGRPECN